MFQDQFHHGYFGWLGAEPGDRSFSTLEEAVAFLHGCTPGVSRRILDAERNIVAYMHKDGRIAAPGLRSGKR